ncbi:MAG: hypothetical protein HDT42_05380 [Ruminococcaceae bacterium]|nr:hypothetical protein [Oscillospiraceae bacterium]
MINRFVFTFLSTSWIWVVYGIEQKCSFICNSIIITSIAMVSAPFLLTAVWLFSARLFSVDNIGGCGDIEEAQNDFLANYLGYVFIGIGVDDILVLVMVYLIIFVLTFAAQSKCFNPVLLIFGYKYYDVITSEGTKVFVVTRRNLRIPNEVEFDNLRRINNMSYIEIRR